MDDFAKKLFTQLDDDSPAVREKALDAFLKSLKAAKQTFRDLLHEIEQGAEAKQKCAALDAKYQEAVQRLRQVKGARRSMLRTAMSWVGRHKLKIALCAALPVAGLCGYERYAREPWPDNADAGLRSLVRNAAWGDQFDKPFVSTVANKPVWVLLRGEINAVSFSDPKGNPVVMRCLHVFAVPAEPNSGEFRRVDPYGVFGWVRWPERLVQCQPSPDQKEAQR
jgi:hypothetical protein